MVAIATPVFGYKFHMDTGNTLVILSRFAVYGCRGRFPVRI